jgi:CheY-like chemotaxis protein
MKALVIDDDDIARELIVSVLQEGGYDAYDLPSPIGATQVLLDRNIDVLVLDLFMPAMSGDKLAKMLRSNARLRSLAIVMVSSCDVAQLGHLADSVKANAVVLKHEIRARLLPTLKNVLRRVAAR